MVFWFIFLIAAILYSSPAHAYLDPSTGGMILQALIAVIAGAGVFIKIYWYRIKTFLFRSSTNDNDSASE